MSTMFQGLFPPLNIQTMKLSDCRRVVLLSYNKETNKIEFRHFLITASPIGITRNIKKIVKATIPNLSNFSDISEYILGPDASDSEGEDGLDNKLKLEQDYFGRGNTPKAPQSSIRLQELGPRMQLQLIKIQSDFIGGTVLFHEYVKKTSEEIELLEQKKQEKIQRKEDQERNVKIKKGDEDEDEIDVNEKVEDSDDEWYREETGEAPQPGELNKTKKRELNSTQSIRKSQKKRMKMNKKQKIIM